MSLIDEAKAQFSIFAVFERYGFTLQGSSSSRKATKCPRPSGHKNGDQNPSLNIWANTQSFHCFTCKWHGDILDLVRLRENLDNNYEAAEHLLQRNKINPIPPPVKIPDTPQPDRRVLTTAMQHYTSAAKYHTKARTYLMGRGLHFKAIDNLGLGFCPTFNTNLYNNLARSGSYTQEEIRDSGLFVFKDDSSYERMINRILVPDFENWEVTWIVGRKLNEDDQYPKYIATPGTPPDALGAGKLNPDAEFVVMCEGIFDYLLVKSWRYPAVCSMGTDGLQKASKAVEHIPFIILTYDNDEAGNRATLEMQALNPGRTTIFPIPPNKKDISEFAQSYRDQQLFHSIMKQLVEKGPIN